MIECGYIKLHRSMLSWEWYSDANTARLFMHLLLTVNYEQQKWRGITIERGQRVCSRSSLAEETGLSEQSVRTAINHLISTGELTKDTTKCAGQKCTIITVKNYEKYQSVSDELTDEATDCQPDANQSLTRHQPECKKEKESKNININNNNARASAEEKKQPTHERGIHGYVKLTDAEYERLIRDLGEVETHRVINYVDELAATTKNKNKWRDWNLVVRRASREGWGKRYANAGESRYGSQRNAQNDRHRTVCDGKGYNIDFSG